MDYFGIAVDFIEFQGIKCLPEGYMHIRELFARISYSDMAFHSEFVTDMRFYRLNGMHNMLKIAVAADNSDNFIIFQIGQNRIAQKLYSARLLDAFSDIGNLYNNGRELSALRFKALRGKTVSQK